MGLPGSGKTGTCSELISLASVRDATATASAADTQYAADSFDIAVVSFDDVAASLGVPGVEGWHAAREEAYARIAAHLAAAKRDCTSSRSVDCGSMRRRRAVVLVDDTMVYRSMRKRVHALAVDAGAAYACVHVETSPEEATARDASRPLSAHVGAATIRREAAASCGTPAPL